MKVKELSSQSLSDEKVESSITVNVHKGWRVETLPYTHSSATLPYTPQSQAALKKQSKRYTHSSGNVPSGVPQTGRPVQPSPKWEVAVTRPHPSQEDEG